MTVGGLAYDWMLTDVNADAKVDSPWTKMKMKTAVPGWNSGCRVVRNRCLVLLFLLCAGRIQSFLWLHHLPKTDKISWQQTPVHSLEIVGQNHFFNKKEVFQTDLSMRLWRALMSKDLHSYERPRFIRFSHDPCSPSMLRMYGTTRLGWGLEIYHRTRLFKTL